MTYIAINSLWQKKMLDKLSIQRVCLGLFLICTASLAAALIAEYVFLLKPCALCIYQRYVYIAIGVAAAIGCIIKPCRVHKFVLYFCTISMFVGVAIAFYHVGVEKGIFELPTSCIDTQATYTNLDELRRQIYASDMPSCDQVAFTFLAISMAGWNGIFSLFIFILLIQFIRRQKSYA